jgi:V8-like Glu-specific endopeptidase
MGRCAPPFITAGHCVFNPRYGGWINKAVFCPRYNNQCTREYKFILVYTLKGWVDDTDWAYDMAACVISEDFASTKPPLTFEYSILTPVKFEAVGYPAVRTEKHPFNGKRMWKSDGTLVSEKDGMIWARNDLTGGASGGPWFNPLGEYHVYGLNSRRADDPDQLASPDFLNGFDNLYNAVKNL